MATNNITNPQTPYPWATPSPTGGSVMGAATTNTTGSDQGWNQAWNQGYNNSTGTSPYSGYALQGFQAGQAQYQTDYANSHPSGGSGPTPQPGPAPSQPSAPSGGGSSGPNPYDLLMQQANSYYDQAMGLINDQSSRLPGQKQDLLGGVDTSYNTLKTGVQSGLDTGIANLGIAREGVGTNLGRGVKALSQQMQNMLQAGNVMLGSRGASNSSANDAYQYALSRQSAQQGTDLQRQANDQLGTIQTQQNDISQQAQDEVSKIDLWKGDQIGAIGQWYQTALGNIDTLKGQALDQKNQMKTSALQGAVSYLQQLDQQATQYKSDTVQKFQDRIAKLNDYRLSVNKSSNFSPTQMAVGEMQGLPGMQSTNGDSYYGANPFAVQQKKQQDYLTGTNWGN